MLHHHKFGNPSKVVFVGWRVEPERRHTTHAKNHDRHMNPNRICVFAGWHEHDPLNPICL
ncbi:hypothetical protein HanIR_Chr04g0167021 [Helianthus annuus]|nr:hypothetical protein HanIR_Chr04g0167021 [Helianthus annuus]